MLIGNGLLAGRFASYANDDQFLIFASGVSNSKIKDPIAYQREANLLKTTIAANPGKTLVYFSTCSIYDPDQENSVYVRHKLWMEEIIQQTTKQHIILRVANVAGRTSNPNTILNYFYYHIKHRINFDLWINACRNIIDIDDVFFIVNELLSQKEPNNRLVNIATPVVYPAKDIVAAIESHLEIKSNYTEVKKGSCFEIDLSAIQPLLGKSETIFDNKYLARLLVKYF